MSIPKVAGIETEYAIVIAGAGQSDPFLASRLLLSAYQQIGNPATLYGSYYPTRPLVEIASENVEISNIPGTASLRERNRDQATPAPRTDQYRQKRLTQNSTDLMLSNGARFYIDHAHPEYSTPECLSPLLLVAADKAGEQILAACQQWVNTNNILPAGQRIVIYKNNSDYKNNSYGCHENYLLSAELFNDLLYRKTHKIFRYLLPFFITRIILCGSGKVGSENGTAPVGFQLSQRADFFEELIGLQTTQRRPLFNTRDEPHADPNRFRRLHVILGDANMAELSTYLKIGTTQLMLQMLEDNFIQVDLTLNNPLQALQVVSRDLSFSEPLALEDGRRMTAVEIQQVYLDLARQYLEQRGGSEEQWEVWDEWEDALNMLPHQWEKLAIRLDWAIKKHLMDRYLSTWGVTWDEITAWQPIIEEPDQLVAVREMVRRAGLSWEDYDKQRALYFGLRRQNLEYHDIRSDADQGEIGLFYRLQQRGVIERIITDEEIGQMTTLPPPDTRSWLRGQCIRRFADSLSSADWNYMGFYRTARHFNHYSLELPDPLMGTEAEMAAFWDQLESPLHVIEHFMPSEKASTGDIKDV